MQLDSLDKKILTILQNEPEISIQEIGSKIGLSHTPTWRRIRKMQDNGLLQGRIWLIDDEKAGLDVSIFVFLRLKTHFPDALEDFENAARQVPEILQCYTMSGEFDYLLRIVVPSVRAFERTIKAKLLKLPHVGIMNSHFALNEIKNTTALPLDTDMITVGEN